MKGINLSHDPGQAVNICPQCGEVQHNHIAFCSLDAVMEDGKPPGPHPGAATVCFNCHAVGVWEDDLSIHLATEAEMNTWDYETRKSVESAVEMLAGIKDGSWKFTRDAEPEAEPRPIESFPTSFMIPVVLKPRIGEA